ncbi:MAG TPA: hypothetical protein DGT23_08210 [Micromonosporaceae bacterium]|nr:hypothetical protein [Micromonosporaceae bacterium]
MKSLFVAVGGLLIGALTLVLQGLLPGSWGHLANSGATWVVAAFFAGAYLGRPALHGTVVLFGEVVGYYGAAATFLNQREPQALVGPAVWLAVALVAGPIFGIAGAWWRDEQRPIRRIVAVALLGGVFIAEGLYLMITLGYLAEGTMMLALGILTPALQRSGADRWRSLAALVPVTALGLLAYWGIGAFSQAVFTNA